MFPAFLLLAYCVLVAIGSAAGGRLPNLIKLTHLRMQITMSLVSGLMLGVAMLHLLPHSLEYSPSIPLATGCMLGGLLVMFFLLRIFHIHYHDDVLEDAEELPLTGEPSHAASHHNTHSHTSPRESQSHGDGDHAHHDHSHAHGPRVGEQRLGWLGLFVGLAVHSLLDGIALGASVVAEGGHNEAEWRLLGLGTFLAVFLHKPLDALSITALMGATGWSVRSQTIVNFSFALACPLGALAFWVGVEQFVVNHNLVVGCALAFSAGFFLCIALSDLLPEVAFHSHDRVKLSLYLLLGVFLAVGIELLHAGSHEVHSPHDHDTPHSVQREPNQHDHHSEPHSH